MPSRSDFNYEMKYQAAFQTILWSMPAVGMYRFRGAARDRLKMNETDIITYARPGTPKLEATTGNSTTPYIGIFPDLQTGAMVLDVPAAGADGSLYGQVTDAWQFSIADISPAGAGAKGGKYLFTPPGYKGPVPSGYIHVASPTYRIAIVLRSIVGQGKTVDDAYRYAQRLRMYYLKDAASPPKQHFVHPDDEVYPTVPYFDERRFEDIYNIFTVEPVREQDKVMMGMLATLGIEPGKPYAPDETAKRAMRQAAVDVWYYMQEWFDNYPKSELYWPDRHYISLLMTDKNRAFTWDYKDRLDYIPRAAEYFWCTWMPKTLSDSPSTQYLMAMGDSQGNPLLAGKTYKLTVPKDMPVKQFWALTLYDRATMAFIYSSTSRTTLSSYDLGTMKKDDDGSVSLYFGPTAPAGLESNWIPTSGKRPLPAIRFYGPTEAMNKKVFKMPDVELVP